MKHYYYVQALDPSASYALRTKLSSKKGFPGRDHTGEVKDGYYELIPATKEEADEIISESASLGHFGSNVNIWVREESEKEPHLHFECSQKTRERDTQTEAVRARASRGPDEKPVLRVYDGGKLAKEEAEEKFTFAQTAQEMLARIDERSEAEKEKRLAKSALMARASEPPPKEVKKVLSLASANELPELSERRASLCSVKSEAKEKPIPVLRTEETSDLKKKPRKKILRYHYEIETGWHRTKLLLIEVLKGHKLDELANSVNLDDGWRERDGVVIRINVPGMIVCDILKMASEKVPGLKFSAYIVNKKGEREFYTSFPVRQVKYQRNTGKVLWM